MQRNYTAFEIANMSQSQVEALPDGGLFVTFANNEVMKCKTSSVRYNWFYWQLFAEEGTGSIMPHNFIGNEAVTQDKHLEMLSRMFWDVFLSKFGVQFSPGVGMTDFWRLSRRTWWRSGAGARSGGPGISTWRPREDTWTAPCRPSGAWPAGWTRATWRAMEARPTALWTCRCSTDSKRCHKREHST